MAASNFEFQPDDDGTLTLETAVFQALGAASACWGNLSGAGVFQSERAQEIGHALVEYVNTQTEGMTMAGIRVTHHEGKVLVRMEDGDGADATALMPPTMALNMATQMIAAAQAAAGTTKTEA